ncbi:cupin domain-containing protein [Scandinavium lactucae]|uniref:Cupin domain-containing protein n=1 Tax=Scandinavium lactucae TaxID=3095028 RepID=A0ABU4QQP3_9ENTR|nr:MULTISPECIES: cupin domain-containing protein [unclassified Scandinavium]MDX6041613.1 cupin domain-containing protein [Scandinavium sp. V105_6]MDX6049534.1 cupin domain-containing protein [Scandinavium sp. V105_1]
MSKQENTLQFGDVAIQILSNSDELTVAELAIQAGAVASIHQHPHEEVNYVVSGVLDFMCDGEVTTLRAGEAMRVPPNQPHNITCHPDAPGVVLTAWSPSRQDLIAKLAK